MREGLGKSKNEMEEEESREIIFASRFPDWTLGLVFLCITSKLIMSEERRLLG